MFNTTFNSISVISWQSAFYWFGNRKVSHAYWFLDYLLLKLYLTDTHLPSKMATVTENWSNCFLHIAEGMFKMICYQYQSFILSTKSIKLKWNIFWVKLEGVYGILRHFQQYFSYSMVVSFIGGGNRRKSLTYRKSNFIT